MPGWLAVPRDWLDSLGEIARFGGRVMGLVYSGRVFRFFGEALRQAGILILGSAIVIWGLTFILGLQCGIEGAYFSRSVGAPSYAGVFAAWCDLREVIPYAFGYMMAAKVGHRDRRRARRDADLRRDRRARGDGRAADDLPLRDPPARRLADAAVHVPGRDRRRLLRLATSRSSSRSARSRRAATS